jgi:hypothetical protein
VSGPAAPGGGAVPAPASAPEERVADAYVWGLPLVVVHRTCALHGGVGRGMAARDRLATPADRTVVAPNNDTLYASGWYDLRAGDLVVEVGPMDTPGRYWSVMLLDAYTEVGYACRRIHGTAGARVRVTYDPAAGPAADPPVRSPDGSADAVGAPAVAPEVAPEVIALGTPTVWVLARVLVAGPDDLPAARAALASITVRESFRGRAERPGVRRAARTGGGGFLGELAAALEVDPPAPWHPAPPEGLDDLLAAPPDPEVVAAGLARGKATVAASRGVDRRRDGWGTRSRGAAFGGDVAYRAAFAQVSLAGHLPAENRSYVRGFDGSAPAVLRFPPGGEPPVDGFWSLCVYGPDLFFVDNAIDRYSVGERTPGLLRDADGGLSIVLGADRPSGPAAGNWLPTPAGPCVLSLRAYEGRPPVVAADWFPPGLVPLA